MKNSNGFVTCVTDSFELVTWHKSVDAFVTRVIVTSEFVTRVENSLYVRQIRFNFYTWNDISERTHKRCHAYVLVWSVQIPSKFRCRYITPSRALHLLTCMLVRSCWYKKSWSYFDNFNEFFNACFVCLFCLVKYKRKKQLWIHIIL